MEALYATPFDRFDRYVPQGTPIQVAERLAELTEAGATAFNLIVPDDEPLRAAEHTGLVGSTCANSCRVPQRFNPGIEAHVAAHDSPLR